MSPAIRTAERGHSLGPVRSSLKPTRPSEMPETREQAVRRMAPWRTGTRAWPAWATGPQNPDSAASRRPRSAPVRHLHNRLLQIPRYLLGRAHVTERRIRISTPRRAVGVGGQPVLPYDGHVRLHTHGHLTAWPGRDRLEAWARAAPLTTSQSVAGSSFRRLGDIRAQPQSPRSPRSVFANRSGVLATSGQAGFWRPCTRRPDREAFVRSPEAIATAQPLPKQVN